MTLVPSSAAGVVPPPQEDSTKAAISKTDRANHNVFFFVFMVNFLQVNMCAKLFLVERFLQAMEIGI